ncbi:hypothetical protein CASFOL_031300 [Castilleja foliolosa]|uniref:Peptidase A1 domain-containing protein n=1 Tax=Castilleja foliolosa TaxID=1961234 RepID=A0ABD3C787_9LAMI
MSKILLFIGYFYFFSHGFSAQILSNLNSDDNTLIQLPSFNAKKTIIHSILDYQELADDEIEPEDFQVEPTVVLNLKSGRKEFRASDSVLESTTQDLDRILTLHTRIAELHKQRLPISRRRAQSPVPTPDGLSGQLTATIRSGVSLGSGEYFMDVYMGTPPKHFSLIIDTGSDLNWIQCDPCYACFEQSGPYYDPKKSTSYRNVSCHDPRCHLVSSPDPNLGCKARPDGGDSCPYFYWYGDSSNTTGDFALETFTVNLTGAGPRSRTVDNVMFGCGHWNRGLFHGASGVLGLGRGELSFASQVRAVYGDSFSYCLVDRNSNTSSKLTFGENTNLLSRPGLNFTTLVVGTEKPVDTFYYVGIKSVVVGGEVLDIPKETWAVSSDGSGGTIVDSGTTLSYFADPAYKIIKEAFLKKVNDRYPVMKDFPILDPCYNVSGVDEPDLPSFGLVFEDGAVWEFPIENYFIRLEPENVVCLAVLGTPRSSLSIIGNYQQQNFHILYDTKRSRLGFALTNCADI